MRKPGFAVEVGRLEPGGGERSDGSTQVYRVERQRQPGRFFCEELMAPCSRMTRANRVVGRREHGTCAKMTSLIS